MILATQTDLAGYSILALLIVLASGWIVGLGMIVETFVRPRLVPWTKVACRLLVESSGLATTGFLVSIFTNKNWEWPALLFIPVTMFPGLAGALVLWRDRKFRRG